LSAPNVWSWNMKTGVSNRMRGESRSPPAFGEPEATAWTGSQYRLPRQGGLGRASRSCKLEAQPAAGPLAISLVRDGVILAGGDGVAMGYGRTDDTISVCELSTRQPPHQLSHRSCLPLTGFARGPDTAGIQPGRDGPSRRCAGRL
jgi:hypothetical protein